MALNIVVCVKNVPSTLSVPVDAATGMPKTAGLVFAMNPFDEYAVEEAVRIKERTPGTTVTAVALGPEADLAVLREAISRGCDAGVLLSGPELQGGDSYTISRALAAAVKKLSGQKPVHLVLFGKNTNDDNSGTVGGQVAAWLDWPGVLSVKKIESLSDTEAVLWRMMEDGVDKVKVKLPAALGTVKEINEPRIPSLKGKMKAKSLQVKPWTAADIAADPEKIGLKGSPTQVVRIFPPVPRGQREILTGSIEEQAAAVVKKLKEQALI